MTVLRNIKHTWTHATTGKCGIFPAPEREVKKIEDKLESYGIPGGPASKLAAAVSALKEPTTSTTVKRKRKDVAEGSLVKKPRYDDDEEIAELKAEVAKLKAEGRLVPELKAEVAKLKAGTSLAQKKKNYPPQRWVTFEEDVKQDVDVEKIWNALKKSKITVEKESSLYPVFMQMLQTFDPLCGSALPVWNGVKNNHSTGALFPDFVIHRGTKWSPTNTTHRANVIIDFELKRRFNPLLTMTAVTIDGYPGDAGRGYVQALERAAAAFKVDAGLSYFVVVTDMEHVIFWKVVPNAEEGTMQAYGAGPYKFGGEYEQQDKPTLRFPKKLDNEKTVPKGFQLLLSLIKWRVKAAAEPITIVNRDFDESRVYTISHLIGKGRSSCVFVTVDPTGQRVCLKLEPLVDSMQLRNEISALETLKSIDGVPHVVFHGITEFRGEKYCALVTDRIAQKSLCDLQKPIDLPDLANHAIEILQQIHAQGLSHNDIKPDHIVFDDKGLFIIDFGASSKLGTEVPFTTQKFCTVSTLLGNTADDFGALWFSFVSLFQELPWDSSEELTNEELVMKYTYEPHHPRWKDSYVSSIVPTFSQLISNS